MIKKISLFVIAAWMLLVAFTLEKAPISSQQAQKGFAVIELFTSEGCSSCPPADALIARIEKETLGQHIYILSYHVDYWNRLGWKDVYSSADCSLRQKRYASWLKLNSVYTPQIMVNGTTEFIGYDESKLRGAIAAKLQQTPENALKLAAPKLEGHQVTVDFQIAGETEGMEMILAAIQPSATSKVSAGENGGRTLSHVQIVNQFEMISLNGKTTGTASLSAPGQQAKNHEYIAFLQDIKTGRITAASKTVFP